MSFIVIPYLIPFRCCPHIMHRFFADKVRLFHEVEYAHVVIFFLGLGLVVQGLALAIVNKELKAVWKFSTEQTLDDVSCSSPMLLVCKLNKY